MNNLTKIIYFDRETIKNILEGYNKGQAQLKQSESSKTFLGTSGELETKLDLGIPFWSRVKFCISGKLSTEYLFRKEDEKLITSTEISEFNKIKDKFTKFSKISIGDVQNSSSLFRVASAFLKIVNNANVGEVDLKKFKEVLDSFEGYDIYKIINEEDKFVRFNSTAFISNYKRNDLLLSQIDIYCLPVGSCNEDDFNIHQQMKNMQSTMDPDHTNSEKLADIYCPNNISTNLEKNNELKPKKEERNITLYDVILSEISFQER